ncbi:hypothetical protein C8R26_103106 [Nitrosomonas oligotropha]|uniref:Uncharacterized protein n=1 Tax=Nitrosomonas oligotropha TaxID=42354 RepID=A0A2T5I3D6_9PROT|nr:hypothetical protein C8R26_103106 [Nitrosomonas oligotropha]
MKIIPAEITQRINANKAFVITKKVQTLKTSSHGHSKKLISSYPLRSNLNNPTVLHGLRLALHALSALLLWHLMFPRQYEPLQLFHLYLIDTCHEFKSRAVFRNHMRFFLLLYILRYP